MTSLTTTSSNIFGRAHAHNKLFGMFTLASEAGIYRVKISLLIANQM